MIDEFEQLNLKIGSLVKSNKEILGAQREILRILRKRYETTCPEEAGVALDVMTLLKLPDFLRETSVALHELGEATAEDLATKTGRLRGVESAYANQLTRMGYLKKKRVGRKVVFSIKKSDVRR